jgi:hypothetical protein
MATSMDDQKRTLHLKRIQEGLAKIAEIRRKRIRPQDSEFQTWDERTSQSLGEVFGKEHDYTSGFRRLSFWDSCFGKRTMININEHV